VKKINKGFFTKRAARDFTNLVDNIKAHQSDKVAKDFIDDLNHVIRLVREQPEMFEASEKLMGRGEVYSINTELFYIGYLKIHPHCYTF
jgi:plasmid stabilization system protein ParE